MSPLASQEESQQHLKPCSQYYDLPIHQIIFIMIKITFVMRSVHWLVYLSNHMIYLGKVTLFFDAYRGIYSVNVLPL